MAQTQETGRAYLCPMHPEVRQPGSGKCPKCGMDLLPERAQFALLRHLAGNPWMLAATAAVMLVIMIAIMVMVR